MNNTDDERLPNFNFSPKNYFVFCLMRNFNIFSWNNSVLTNYGLRTDIFCVDWYMYNLTFRNVL